MGKTFDRIVPALTVFIPVAVGAKILAVYAIAGVAFYFTKG
jgi:hypothetical protein